MSAVHILAKLGIVSADRFVDWISHAVVTSMDCVFILLETFGQRRSDASQRGQARHPNGDPCIICASMCKAGTSRSRKACNQELEAAAVHYSLKVAR